MLELQAASPDDVPPVIVTPHHYLINIYRSSIYLVAVVTKEGNACMCTAWLYLNFFDDKRLMFIAVDFLQFLLYLLWSFCITFSIYLMTTFMNATNLPSRKITLSFMKLVFTCMH